jgi:hypothetical protein
MGIFGPREIIEDFDLTGDANWNIYLEKEKEIIKLNEDARVLMNQEHQLEREVSDLYPSTLTGFLRKGNAEHVISIKQSKVTRKRGWRETDVIIKEWYIHLTKYEIHECTGYVHSIEVKPDGVHVKLSEEHKGGRDYY